MVTQTSPAPMFIDGCYVPEFNYEQAKYTKDQVQTKVAEASDEFVRPTQCAMPDCQVTVTFGDEHRKLYVCKRTLVNLSEYFKNLLVGHFRERNSSVIHFEDIAYSDMILFLRCAAQTNPPPRPIPYDLASLSALNALADRFLVPSICKKIIKRFGFGFPPRADIQSLCEMISLPGLFCGGLEKVVMELFDNYQLFEKSIEDKLAMLEFADKHRGSGTVILEKCIRLCANLQMSDVSAFHGKVSGGTVAAFYATIDKAFPKLAHSPKHFCFYVNRKNRSYRPYDHISLVDSRKKWGCTHCNRSENVNVKLAVAQKIEIDKKLIMDKGL